MKHKFAEDPYDPHCQVCGASYHCPNCEDGCGMMGHQDKDADGWFYTCGDKSRVEQVQANRAIDAKAKRYRDYLRLKEEFG